MNVPPFRQRLAFKRRELKELTKKGEVLSLERDWGRDSLQQLQKALEGGPGSVKKPASSKKSRENGLVLGSQKR